jgi:lipopolysaccharide transport system permease protein
MQPKMGRTYSWEKPGRWTPRFWRDVFRRLTDNHELIWRLFLRDFHARYRQTLLGLAWAIIVPLIAVGTFVLLNQSGILDIGEISVPYPLYALLGLTVWQIFAGGLVVSSNSLVVAGSMVVKVDFPRETLVVASLGQVVVEFIVRLTLLIGLCIFYGFVPAAAALWFPAALIPLVLTTVGLGFVLALVNVVVRDVANMVVFVTSFLLFLTPVLYPVPEHGPLAVVSRYNPLAILVRVPCDLVVEGRVRDPETFTLAAVLSIVFFLFSWRLFVLTEMRMTERMGTR